MHSAPPIRLSEGAPPDLLRAYLPGTLIHRWLREPDQPANWHERLHGSLMHCDMSGFTAMSERLAGLGKEGAELMAGVLNRFFDRMIRIAIGWGGVQMKFGGDAMLLYFDGESSAIHAAAAALEMQSAMREFRTVNVHGEDFALRMRAGIHSASFLAASAGDAQGTLHYLLIGHDVSMAAITESRAPLGGVVASETAAAQLRAQARLTRHDDVWRVSRISQVERPTAAAGTDGADPAVLRRYLLPPFSEEFREGRAPHVIAEHRRVTAIFINLIGIADLMRDEGDAGAVAQADEYVRMALESLERHGGYLLGSDASEHGDKLICVFGAPVLTGNDEANAMRFALDLDARLRRSELTLQHQIGICTGSVFAGEIGSAVRREYTIIGDSVNLAARMMTAAGHGEIYVAASTVERTDESQFLLHPLQPMRVKGKSAPVRAYRLEAIADAAVTRRVAHTTELVGREAEVRQLLEVGASAIASGSPAWAHVRGDAGIGKSALTETACRRLEGEGWRMLASYAQLHLSRDVFAAWTEPLRELIGSAVPGRGDVFDAARARVSSTRPQLVPYVPLLAPLLGLPLDESDPAIRYLDARARRQRIGDIVVALIEGTASVSPLLLLFEDVNQADEPSLDLLGEVMDRVRAPLALITTSREHTLPDSFANREGVALELGELPPADSLRLVLAGGVDDALADDLVARAQGNPLFLQELALNAGQSGETPDSINDVILARIDRLRGEDKALLRAAAIEGVTFVRAHLGPLLGARAHEGAIGETLRRLGDLGFTQRVIELADGYSFRHALTQEVLYETVPFAERRSMHGALARQIEGEAGDSREASAAVLLHHSERADDWPRALTYAAMAGERAARVYAGHQAISYYARGVSALERLPLPSASDRSMLYQRIGESMEMQGRHGPAAEALRDALTAWRWRGPRRARRYLKPDVPDATREALLVRTLAVSYERRSAYEEALALLDEAIAVLPRRSGNVGAQVFGARSVTHFRLGQYAEAATWGRRALAAARRTKDARSIAYAHNMLANALVAEGSLRRASMHLAEAVRLYNEAGDVPGQASANNNLGMCFHQMGDLDAALTHYRNARDADERVGDLVDMAIADNNIGEILLVQGKLDEAREHLARVIAAHAEGDELAAVTGYAHINLSRVALAAGDVEGAANYLRDGEVLLRSVGAAGLLNEARIQRAEVLLARADVEGAEGQILQGREEARSSGDRLLEARALRVQAAVRLRQGQAAEAERLLGESASLARKIGAGHEEALALLAHARLRRSIGKSLRRSGLERTVEILRRMRAADSVVAQALLDAAPASPDTS